MLSRLDAFLGANSTIGNSKLTLLIKLYIMFKNKVRYTVMDPDS